MGTLGDWNMTIRWHNGYLIGGLEHFLIFHILGMSSSQLTFIFFRGVDTTNQFINLDFLPDFVSG